jgi:hypothetical protein
MVEIKDTNAGTRFDAAPEVKHVCNALPQDIQTLITCSWSAHYLSTPVASLRTVAIYRPLKTVTCVCRRVSPRGISSCRESLRFDRCRLCVLGAVLIRHRPVLGPRCAASMVEQISPVHIPLFHAISTRPESRYRIPTS